MKTQPFNRYFILWLVIFSYHECLTSQTNSWVDMERKNGIFVAPVSAFDSRGEIQLGYSRLFNESLKMDVSVGVRYKSVNDPAYQQFEEEKYIGQIERSNASAGSGGFMQSSTSSNYDVDAPDLNTEFEAYIISNNFVQVELNWFSSIDDAASPIYFSAGMMLGQRSYYQYESVSGNIYKNKTLIDYWSDTHGDGWFESGSYVATYSLDKYSYQKLSKSKITEPYVNPFVGVGFQLPFLKIFSIDGSGIVFYGNKSTSLIEKEKLHVFANMQLTMWF